MSVNKTEERLQNLEIGRRHFDEELIEIHTSLSQINKTLSNHIVHLQEAVRLLGLKSWLGLFSDGAIMITTIITLILTLRHH